MSTCFSGALDPNILRLTPAIIPGAPFKPAPSVTDRVGLSGASFNPKLVSELAFRGGLNPRQCGLLNPPDLVK